MIFIFYNLRKNETLITNDGHCMYWQFVVLFHPASLEELIAENSHEHRDENSHVPRVGLPHCTYSGFLADDID
jgi:hypothetical protein